MESTHQWRVPPALQDQAHCSACRKGKVLFSCFHHLIPQNAPLKMHWAFFPFSNHMLSACLTSLAARFLSSQKVYLVQVTFSPNISFSIATWIRANCPSDLSQILTAAYLPLKAEWWQDREVKHSGSIWACFQSGEFVRMLCSCSSAVTKPQLSSAKASVAVNKAILINRK